MSFQSKSFFGRQMSEKVAYKQGKAVVPTDNHGVFGAQRHFRSAADTNGTIYTVLL